MSRWPLACLWALLGVTTLLSCQNTIEAEKQEAQITRIENYIKNLGKPAVKAQDVYQIIQSPGFGYKIAMGDTVSFLYIGYTLDGRVFDTNRPADAAEYSLDITFRNLNPIEVVIGSNNLTEGLGKGLAMCRGGELSSIIFPSSLGFGDKHMAHVPPWSPLAYDVLIISVYNDSIRNELSRVRQIIDGKAPLRFKFDTLGIWYTPPKQGITASLGDTIFGWYQGITTNGIVVHQSAGDTAQIILRDGKLPIGLLNAFTLYPKSDSATVIVPSCNIRGSELLLELPPYTPLIYSLRVDSIIGF
jgi:FKBP-type peptidyl-prolyl cis-trans isomerase